MGSSCDERAFQCFNDIVYLDRPDDGGQFIVGLGPHVGKIIQSNDAFQMLLVVHDDQSSVLQFDDLIQSFLHRHVLVGQSGLIHVDLSQGTLGRIQS